MEITNIVNVTSVDKFIDEMSKRIRETGGLAFKPGELYRLGSLLSFNMKERYPDPPRESHSSGGAGASASSGPMRQHDQVSQEPDSMDVDVESESAASSSNSNDRTAAWSSRLSVPEHMSHLSVLATVSPNFVEESRASSTIAARVLNGLSSLLTRIDYNYVPKDSIQKEVDAPTTTRRSHHSHPNIFFIKYEPEKQIPTSAEVSYNKRKNKKTTTIFQNIEVAKLTPLPDVTLIADFDQDESTSPTSSINSSAEDQMNTDDHEKRFRMSDFHVFEFRMKDVNGTKVLDSSASILAGSTPVQILMERLVKRHKRLVKFSIPPSEESCIGVPERAEARRKIFQGCRTQLGLHTFSGVKITRPIPTGT